MLLFSTIAIAVAATMPRELTAVEKANVTAAVVEKLKDGESARFRWVPWRGGIHYCGYVNAKNSLGGYVGFVRYFAIVDDRGGKIGTFVYPQLADTDPTSAMSAFVAESCAKAGYSN